jgi:hypothetical protein
VKGLANPVSYLQGLAWACLGGAISSALALIVWYPTYAQLSPQLQMQFAWVAVSIWIFMAAMAVLSVHAFIVNWRVSRRFGQVGDDVVEEMDEIVASYVGPPVGPQANGP